MGCKPYSALNSYPNSVSGISGLIAVEVTYVRVFMEKPQIRQSARLSLQSSLLALLVSPAPTYLKPLSVFLRSVNGWTALYSTYILSHEQQLT
jgi:hypothetical protein